MVVLTLADAPAVAVVVKAVLVVIKLVLLVVLVVLVARLRLLGRA
jgi:hypothetical protein